MNAENPYKPPADDGAASPPARSALKTLSTVLLVLGLIVLAYGATAFWVINALPPNGGAAGRLPSLYVMGVGVAVALVGLVVRDFRLRQQKTQASDAPRKGIPASLGILILLAIVIVFFLIVSRL